MLFWSSVAVGSLVLALILWCVVRYRRRPGDGDGLPRQTPGNVPLEIAYTAAPFVLAAVLFGLTLGAEAETTADVPGSDVRVDVTGFRWQWRFDYPEDGVTVVGTEERPPELVLPVGRTVRFRLVAADVIHSFYVPAFLVKRDVVPGRDTRLELKPNRTGRFGANCAEFCGLDHARMGFAVRVVEPAEFRSWLAANGRAPEGAPA